MKNNITLLSNSMHVDTSYIQRKTARVTTVPQVGNICKMVDFIQCNAERLNSQPIIIHTGTNDVVNESQFTTERRLKSWRPTYATMNMPAWPFVESSIVAQHPA